jgi:tRNA 2-thiouridine synthesizing protein A
LDKQEIEMKTIDARGLSCPQPAMMARQAMQQMKNGTIELLVDSGTSRDNCTRQAEHAGWRVQVQDETDDSFRLVLER